jgi:ribulose-5-phosphate 4-epimerase/fuculose-1-phosphate aldolase
MNIPSLKDQVSPEEWALRVELAACYRLVALYGWSDLVFTHISARLPGPEHQFLINPYGLMFDEITASSLVKVDQHCNKLIDSPFPVNPAGFVIHSAVHEVRDDAACVLHTHTRAGVGEAARVQTGGMGGAFVWPALIRKLDKLGPGYKD